MNQSTNLPVTFKIIAIVALIWNLIGVFSFYIQMSMDETTIAALPEAEQALYAATPAWLNIAFGLAVATGVIGSVLLLMKKASSVPVFLISLIAILIQMGYWLLAMDTIDVYGIQAVIMPILVIAIGVFLWYYAKSSKAKGWIS